MPKSKAVGISKKVQSSKIWKRNKKYKKVPGIKGQDHVTRPITQGATVSSILSLSLLPHHPPPRLLYTFSFST